MTQVDGRGVAVLTSPPWRRPRRNPYNHLLYSRLSSLDGVRVDDYRTGRALSGSYDICHVHWPEVVLRGPRSRVLYRAAKLLGALAGARARGTRVVWTVHNLAPHEAFDPRLARAFWAAFLPCVDAAISLSSAGASAARGRFARLEDVPVSVVPHGHYCDWYGPAVEREEARARLGLPRDAATYLFFGQIRPYKGVGQLLDVFAGTVDRSSRLVVAGEPRSWREARVVGDRAGMDGRVVLRLGEVDAAEVPGLFGAADLVVLPVRDGLHSGSAMLALSLGRPVLLPATPTFAELRDQVGDAWVRLYDGELTPEVLEREVARPAPTSGPDLSAFDWEVVADETLAAYERVLAR